MDSEVFRAVLRNTGLDLWALIDNAISVAATDHGAELKARRDGIVERLYVGAVAGTRPSEVDGDESDGGRPPIGRRVEEEKESGSHQGKGGRSPPTPESVHKEEDAEEQEEEEEEDEEEEEYGNYGRRGRRSGSVAGDDEQTKILAIKEHLEDPDQDEETVVNLLQNLADMDITFKALQETDIGRHVNRLRKHQSGEVRRLVKLLVRKWKDLVDDWVKLNSNEASAAAIITDGDSPQQIPAKSYHQIPEFGYSPNHLRNGTPSSERNSWEQELKPKPKPSVPRVTPPHPAKQRPAPPPSSAPLSQKAKEQQKDSLLDPERLASARRRLHENYQEAQNAKKQRTIQVMDINEIPKKKNTFFPRNKQAKHW